MVCSSWNYENSCLISNKFINCKARKQFLNQNCHVLGTSYKNNPSLSFMEQSQSNCRIENTSMQYLALLIVVVSSVSLVYFPLFCFKDSSLLR